MCSFDKTKFFFAVNDGIYLFSEAGMYSAALHFQESKREGLPPPRHCHISYGKSGVGGTKKKPVLSPFPVCTVQGKERERSGFFSPPGLFYFQEATNFMRLLLPGRYSSSSPLVKTIFKARSGATNWRIILSRKKQL